MTIIPPTTPTGTEGLRCHRGIWHVRYEADGIVRTRTTRTGDPDKARVVRDRIFAALKAGGAIVAAGKAARTRLGVMANPADDRAYIYQRPPFIVSVAGTFLGEFASREAAREARNAYLGAGENGKEQP